MKTNLIIKTILMLALAMQISLTANTAQAQQVEGNDRGNGGGGVQQDGRYMTFYSAGVMVENKDLTIEDVPQLKYLYDLMTSTVYFNATTSMRYGAAISPSNTRKYYNVKSDSFTPAVKERLLAEYGRITGLNTKNLAIFAITDIPNKTTYLFPEFYQLQKPTEQAAILFHEAFWLTNQQATYKEVVNAEMAFQGYLENMSNDTKLFNWLQKTLNTEEALAAAQKIDLDSGALDSLMNIKTQEVEETVIDSKGKSKKKKLTKNVKVFNLENLIGADSINCYASGGINIQCTPLIYKNLVNLKRTIKNSFLIETALNLINSGKTVYFATVNSNGSLELAYYTSQYGSGISSRGFSLSANYIDLNIMHSALRINAIEADGDKLTYQIGFVEVK